MHSSTFEKPRSRSEFGCIDEIGMLALFMTGATNACRAPTPHTCLHGLRVSDPSFSVMHSSTIWRASFAALAVNSAEWQCTWLCALMLQRR